MKLPAEVDSHSFFSGSVSSMWGKILYMFYAAYAAVLKLSTGTV